MRILLADEQPRVRSAIRLLLEQQLEENTIDDVSNSQELLNYVRNCCPDLLFLDWELPDLAPDNLLMKLRTSHPDLVIIALDSKPETRQAALGAGANEFVSKNEPPDRLLEVVKRSIISEKKLRN